MKLLYFSLTLLMASLCYAKSRAIRSPKDAEFQASLVKVTNTVTKSSLLIPITSLFAPKTNAVYKRTFLWDYDDDISAVHTFKLYMGESPGSYTILEDAGVNWNGTNYFYIFLRTNWDERMDRHFAVVTAADASGLESLPSNEIHWPAFPPDHVRVMWLTNYPDPVTIYHSSDVRLPMTNWPMAAIVMGYTNAEFLMGISDFFYIDKPEHLSIEAYNPFP